MNFRINQIYDYALQKQRQPFSFISQQFSQISGLPIDGIIVIKTQSLLDIPKRFGSIDIYLDKALIDNQYPNPCHISNPKECSNPYTTISFDEGWNEINTDNIAPFVRSRKNAQTTDQGGTDLGRSYRQQLLLKALLKKFENKQFLLNNYANLYNFWHQEIDSNLSDEFILSMLFKLKSKLLKLETESHQIPVTIENENSQAVLYHPARFKYGAWVFLPVAKDLNDFSHLQQFIKKIIEN